MTTLVCSTIVGFLCIQAPLGDTLDVRLEDKGIFVADTIRAKDWTLSWGRSMEWAPPRLDMSKLAEVCKGSTCIRYWRKCDDAARPLQCSFAVGLAGNSSVFFDLAASTADGMKHAMQALQIVVDLPTGAAVPLAKLDRDGPSDQAPVLPADNAPP
jgi:hypothetical protein